MHAILQIEQAKLFAYKLPFKHTLNFNGRSLKYRSGLILQLQNAQGGYSFGEIAPLPGFSRETLAQATEQIISLLNTGISQLSLQHNLYPSVQFALDNAFAATPFTSLCLNHDSIPLLQGTAEDIITQYLSLNKPDLIKLKVARYSVQQEVLLFNQLTTLNSNMKLRCDANRAWSKTQAEQFFRQINTQKIDYIEEPTACYADNLVLASHYKFSLALDETLLDTSFYYQPAPCIKALILKPTLLGSLAKMQHFITLAKKQQLQVSISSSFESILGLNQLMHLAQANHDVDISLGLDTVKYFQAGLLTDPAHIMSDIQALECLWTSH